MLNHFLRDRYKILLIEQYRLFFIGSILSRLGNAIHFITINWLMIHLSGSVAAAAYISGLSAIAALFAAPLAGVIADRSDARRMHRILDVLLAFISLSLPITMWMAALSIYHVMLVIVLLAAGTRFSVVLARVIVRVSVHDDLLLEANSTLSFANQAGSLFGSIIAGFLISLEAEATAFALNSTSFLVSASCLSLMILRKPSAIQASKTRKRTYTRIQEWIEDFNAGVLYAKGNEVATRLYGCLVVLMCGLTVLNTLLPALVKSNLGGSPVTFGFVDAGFGMGGMLSSIFIPSIVRRLGRKKVIVGASLLFALLTALLPLSFMLVVTWVMYVLIGVLFHAWVVLLTAAQMEVDSVFQGRMQSLYEVAIAVAALLVSSLAYYAIQYSLAFAYAGYALILSSCFMIFLFRKGTLQSNLEASTR